MARPEVIQVQFKPEEADRIRASAETLGLSQSAYIRRIVMSKILVPAWWARAFDAPGMKVMAIRSSGVERMHKRPADFFLELLYETDAGGAAYKVFDEDGSPLTFDRLRDQELIFRDLHRGRLMMGGSHMLWEIVRSVEDANLEGQLIWLLAADRREDSEPASPVK